MRKLYHRHRWTRIAYGKCARKTDNYREIQRILFIAGERAGVASAAAAVTSARSAGSFGRLKLASLRDEKSADGVSFPEKPRVAGLFKDVLQQKGGIE